jgi:hypothetical protein
MAARLTGIAASIALASAMLATAATTSTGSARRAAADDGGLRLGEHLKPSNSLYTEGALEYVTIRKTGSRALVVRRKFALGKINLARRLPARRYRIASYTRTCSGNCDHLDPPAYACGRTVTIKRGATLRATVESQVGKVCRITVRFG